MKWAKSLLCLGLAVSSLAGLCGCAGDQEVVTADNTNYISAQEATEMTNQRVFDSVVPADWEGTTDEYFDYYKEIHGVFPIDEVYKVTHDGKSREEVEAELEANSLSIQSDKTINGSYYDLERKHLNITPVEDGLIVNSNFISNERGSGTIENDVVSFSIPDGDGIVKGTIGFAESDKESVIMTITESTAPGFEAGMTHEFHR